MGAPGSLFEIWTWMASFGMLAMLQQFIPREYIDWFNRVTRGYFRRMSSYIYCEVPEFDNGVSNKLYQDVKHYLSSETLQGAQRVNICKSKQQRAPTFSLCNDEGIYDTFEGAKLFWVHTLEYRQGSMYGYFSGIQDEKRKFTLRIKEKDKERILDAYTKHIESLAKERERESRDLLLYTNSSKNDGHSYRWKRWQSVTFMHPANFDTLALDGDLKTKILDDLEKFTASEDLYKKVGKAWKRGYLLYGPPGTGKSSMIAAIANKMRYDIYDIELTNVDSNTELRKLLLHTSSKSIIVIEDIDCSLDLSGQRKKIKEEVPEAVPGVPPRPQENARSDVTLSGLLNFVDGLWSCCGSERIFIFTTNYKEKLDPALLRAGRMDMHIHLNYCTFSAFQTLSRNYLQLTDHEMFEDVERAFQGTYMTPAEVSEVLIKNLDDSPDVVLQKLIESLWEHREDPRLKALAEEKAAEEKAAEEMAAEEMAAEEKAAEEKAAEEKAAEEKAAEEKAAEEKAAEEKDAEEKAVEEKDAEEEDAEEKVAEENEAQEGDEKLKERSKKVSEDKEEEETKSEERCQKASESVQQTKFKDAGQKAPEKGDTKQSTKAMRKSGEKIVPVGDTDFVPDQKTLTSKPVQHIVSTVRSTQV